MKIRIWPEMGGEKGVICLLSMEVSLTNVNISPFAPLSHILTQTLSLLCICTNLVLGIAIDRVKYSEKREQRDCTQTYF